LVIWTRVFAFLEIEKPEPGVRLATPLEQFRVGTFWMPNNLLAVMQFASPNSRSM
jgi:hypothetical protein